MGVSQLSQYASDLFLSEMGQKDKNILLNDTTAITSAAFTDGYCRMIVVLTNCTFTTLTGNYYLNGVSSLATGADFGTLYAGTVLSGKFSAITLASGSVLLIE